MHHHLKLNRFLKELESERILCLVGPLKSDSNILKSNLLKLFVDGGANKKAQFKFHAKSLSIGDNDSFHGNLDILLPKKKNYSDLEAALELITHRADIIIMEGFISYKKELRFDHLLSMFQSVFTHVRLFHTFVFINEDLIMLPIGTHHLWINDYFGIITFKKTTLQILGKAKYQLKNKTIIPTISTITCSNKGFGIVTIKTDKPVLLTINKE